MSRLNNNNLGWVSKVHFIALPDNSVMIIRATNYVYQQTLKPDDDYVLPHQSLWTFDVLVCPLSAFPVAVHGYKRFVPA